MDDAARRTGPNGDRPDHGRLGPGSRHRSGVPQRGRPRRPGSGATAARGGVDRRFQPSAGQQRGTRDRSSRSPVRVMRQRPATARPSEPGGRRELARHLAAGCQRTLVQGRRGKAGALRRRALGGGGVEPRRVVGGRPEVCGARGPDADGRPGRTAAACGLSASRSYGRARPHLLVPGSWARARSARLVWPVGGLSDRPALLVEMSWPSVPAGHENYGAAAARDDGDRLPARRFRPRADGPHVEAPYQSRQGDADQETASLSPRQLRVPPPNGSQVAASLGSPKSSTAA